MASIVSGSTRRDAVLDTRIEPRRANDIRVHHLDAPPTEAQLAAADAELANGLTTITTWWEPGSVIVGPPVRHGRPGCLRCLVVRRAACRPELVPAVDRFVHDRPFTFTDRHELVHSMIDDLVDVSLSTGWVTTDPGIGFFVLRLRDLSVAQHRFLPMPLCPTCGSVPDDAPLPADSFDEYIKKPAVDMYRAASLFEVEGRLRDLYVDAEAGIVRHVRLTESDAAAEIERVVGCDATQAAAVVCRLAEAELLVPARTVTPYGHSGVAAALESAEPASRTHELLTSVTDAITAMVTRRAPTAVRQVTQSLEQLGHHLGWASDAFEQGVTAFSETLARKGLLVLDRQWSDTVTTLRDIGRWAAHTGPWDDARRSAARYLSDRFGEGTPVGAIEALHTLVSSGLDALTPLWDDAFLMPTDSIASHGLGGLDRLGVHDRRAGLGVTSHRYPQPGA